MAVKRKRSIWTAANIVTVSRVALVPLWLLLAEVLPASDGSAFSVGAFFVFLLFCALSLTDSLDGYLARSMHQVTDFGKFLDPIADKLVVIVALSFLLEKGIISSWVMLIVVGREFLISALRMVVAAKGTVISASMLGKVKTALTMVAIGGLLLCRALPAGGFLNVIEMISSIVLAAAIFFTVWSGVEYMAKSWKYVDGR